MANPSSSDRFDFLKVLWNPAGSQIIAYASQIWDDLLGKRQSEINASIPKKTSDLQNDSGFLTQHQNISGKANKAVPAATGNFAKLKADGDLEDSGKKASDFAAADHNHDGVYQPAGSYAPATHSHAISDVAGLQDALDEIRDIAEVALVM